MEGGSFTPVCSAMGVFWVLEQPLNSLLEHHEALQMLFGLVKCYQISINMEDYGARSQKPTWLYSSALFALQKKVCSLRSAC